MLSVEVARNLGAFRVEARFEGPTPGVTTLFGASGAGKSSILSMVAGATRPERGRIAIGERVLFDSAAGIDIPMEERRIGWVFQDARLFPHLSVRKNLLYGFTRAPQDETAISFEDVIGVLGIGHLLERAPRSLSGGEKQRVALGRALLAQPRLLLLDEPLAALDAARKAEILPFLVESMRRFALPALYVTHALGEVVRLSDQMVVMDQGAVIAQGPPRDLLARADLPILADRAEPGSLIEARMTGRSADGGALCVVNGAQLSAPVSGEIGDIVRLYVFARDVILALAPPQGLSVRNILPCRITALDSREDGGVLVTLEAGETRLLSAITQEAVTDLQLRPGLELYALIKAAALKGGARGLLDALN